MCKKLVKIRNYNANLVLLSRVFLRNYLSGEGHMSHSENIYVEVVRRRILFEIGQKLEELDLVKNVSKIIVKYTKL